MDRDFLFGVPCFLEHENVLKLDSDDGCTICDCIKNH